MTHHSPVLISTTTAVTRNTTLLLRKPSMRKPLILEYDAWTSPDTNATSTMSVMNADSTHQPSTPYSFLPDTNLCQQSPEITRIQPSKNILLDSFKDIPPDKDPNLMGESSQPETKRQPTPRPAQTAPGPSDANTSSTRPQWSESKSDTYTGSSTGGFLPEISGGSGFGKRQGRQSEKTT